MSCSCQGCRDCEVDRRLDKMESDISQLHGIKVVELEGRVDELEEWLEEVVERLEEAIRHVKRLEGHSPLKKENAKDKNVDS